MHEQRSSHPASASAPSLVVTSAGSAASPEASASAPSLVVISVGSAASPEAPPVRPSNDGKQPVRHRPNAAADPDKPRIFTSIAAVSTER